MLRDAQCRDRRPRLSIERSSTGFLRQRVRATPSQSEKTEAFWALERSVFVCLFYHADCRYFGSTRRTALIRGTCRRISAGYCSWIGICSGSLQTAEVFLQEHCGKLPVPDGRESQAAARNSRQFCSVRNAYRASSSASQAPGKRFSRGAESGPATGDPRPARG